MALKVLHEFSNIHSVLTRTKLSQDIMTLFSGQMETASSRMSFLINPSLKQQIEYLKVQVKFQHVQQLNEKFDDMKDDMIEDIQEQIEVFGAVYQPGIKIPYRLNSCKKLMGSL